VNFLEILWVRRGVGAVEACGVGWSLDWSSQLARPAEVSGLRRRLGGGAHAPPHLLPASLQPAPPHDAHSHACESRYRRRCARRAAAQCCECRRRRKWAPRRGTGLNDVRCALHLLLRCTRPHRRISTRTGVCTLRGVHPRLPSAVFLHPRQAACGHSPALLIRRRSSPIPGHWHSLQARCSLLAVSQRSHSSAKNGLL
jgi:hypothetical protein